MIVIESSQTFGPNVYTNAVLHIHSYAPVCDKDQNLMNELKYVWMVDYTILFIQFTIND